MTKNLENAEEIGEPIGVLDFISKKELKEDFHSRLRIKIRGVNQVHVPHNHLSKVDRRKIITFMQDIDRRPRVYPNGKDVTSKY